MPFWSSRTNGFAENAISSSVTRQQDREGDRPAAGRSGWRAGGHRSAPWTGGHGAGVSAADGVRLGDQHAVHVVELLEDDAGAAGDAGQRVVGDVDRHLGRLGDAPVEAGEQRAATGEHDALVHDVGDELRRRLLDRVLDRVDDLVDGRLDRLADLVGADLDAARQPGQQVAAAEGDALRVPLARVGGADRDLDVLGRPLAEEQVVLAPGERDDVLVHLVAADADGAADDDAAEPDDRDLGRAAADVDDEAARRLADRQAGADRGGHRLLDQARPARAGVERRVADGALLDLGHARRDAEQHPRPRDQPDPVVDPVHEVLDHLLGHVEVADDAVAQRPDRDDVRRRPADHPLRLGADRQDPLRLGVDRDDRRLADDDPAIPDVDQRVGGPEVDPDVAGEEAEQAVEHGRERSSVIASAGRGRLGRRPGRDRGRVTPMAAGSGRAGPRSIPEARRSGRRASPAAGASQAYARRPARRRRPIEGDAAVAQRDVGVVADHEVVEQVDVEQPAGGERLGGQVQVVR